MDVEIDRLITELPIYFSSIHSVFKLHKNDTPSKDDILVVAFDVKNYSIEVKYEKFIDNEKVHAIDILKFDIDYDIMTNQIVIKEFEKYIENFGKHLVLDAQNIYCEVTLEMDHFPSYQFESHKASKYIEEYLSVITFCIQAAHTRMRDARNIYERYSRSDSYNTLEKCEKQLLCPFNSRLGKEVLTKYIEIKFRS